MAAPTSFLMLYFVCGFSIAFAATPNITTDQSALLALKAHISFDPQNHLTNNWSTNTSVCNWEGVLCDSRHYRVMVLDLSFMGLVGTIPPHIGNLSFLVSLSIQNNSFHGSIPIELSHLTRLKFFHFGYNEFDGAIPSQMGSLSKLRELYLHKNNFIGTIPQSLFNISSLQIISLGFNQLSGTIPSSIFKISSLQEIYLGPNRLSRPMPSIFFNISSLQIIALGFNMLHGGLSTHMFDHLPNLQFLAIPRNLTMLTQLLLGDNNFEGRLPPEIENLTMLKELQLSYNNFEGLIPNQVDNLQNLELFDIGINGFFGTIPFGIFNISTIRAIALEANNLSGQLPSNMGLFLPSLQQLILWGNKLRGTIPNSISNTSQLVNIDLGQNSFSGLIPKTLGNLRFLQRLRLEWNDLTVESPELSIFSYLSNCINLVVLALGKNHLNGFLPKSIGNLSISLQKLRLYNCELKGSIPIEIEHLSGLTTLTLTNNKLSGLVPTTIGSLHMLQGLYLGGNRLKGTIPPELCYLRSLFQLYLDNMTSLRSFRLDFNQLTSVIPLSLWRLTDLLEVDFSSNSLSGSLSSEIEKIKVLRILNLSRNQLSGDIPKTIGGLKDLTKLSLAINQLEGSIPISFGELVSLEFLDLSDNNLSGEIPKSLEGLHSLKYLNLSFNKLQGEIPTRGPFLSFSVAAFMSNKALCGATRLKVPPCEEGGPHKTKTTWPNMLRYVLPAIGFIMLALTLAFAWKRWKKRNPKSPAQVDLYPLVTWRRISHQQLVQATNGFSSNNLLGEGSFGSVYQGTLLDGMMNIAVKIMNMQVKGAFKSFDVECEVLRNIRHRNLVKIISICRSIDFKAFVLEYMPNGNLDIWLHSEDHYLNILQRLNIMIDIVSALEYLHHGYSTTIIHCDLKPSNVLLDEEMVAHVADFGMAKLLDDRDSMMQTMTLATFGYMAPEYGSEGVVSTRGDVYSYGMLLMETFTRKKPKDGMFIGEMTLKHWVDESLLTSILDIVDANLLRNEKEHAAMEDCISSVMRLALECCAESPTQRIDIKNVSATLNKLKSKFVLDIRTS
ncbi:hypothetical protein CIPAW_10G102200 [Carya illinoinensis]|uniref:non-specific serine/threonine protein kinase n=2 Tax=Carya illinoinensis TaxID=32201 RepID=A0A8T1PE80_CARIL|nr:hypothetical protein CIPAW_10G102200 [Carya illinoinensis]